MARKILNRKELRAAGEAAELPKRRKTPATTKASAAATMSEGGSQEKGGQENRSQAGHRAKGPSQNGQGSAPESLLGHLQSNRQAHSSLRIQRAKASRQEGRRVDVVGEDAALRRHRQRRNRLTPTRVVFANPSPFALSTMDKNSILITIMVFCLVVIVFQLGFNSGDSFGWIKMIGGLLLASLAAGATLAATGGMKK